MTTSLDRIATETKEILDYKERLLTFVTQKKRKFKYAKANAYERRAMDGALF